MSYINEDMYTEIFTNYLGFESIRDRTADYGTVENLHINFINSNKIFGDEIQAYEELKIQKLDQAKSEYEGKLKEI